MQKQGGGKKKRRDNHAGRARGSTKQTGNSGGPKTTLSHLDKALITPYLNQRATQMRRRSEREKGR